MDYQNLLRTGEGPPVAAALIGVGQFGRTLLAQSRRIEGLALRVLCDADLERARRHCLAAGLPAAEIAICDTAAAASRALGSGRTVLTADAALAAALPVDVVVEATGDAEAGARTVLAAIGHGRHVVLVTKETDAVVGPILSRRARAAGLVLAQVDGDQPSLTLGLISWARALGLTVACAGKASEHDLVFDPATGHVRAAGSDAEAVVDPALWTSGDDLPARIAARAAAMAAIPQRTPPDFCELCVMANASGLRPDRPDLHAAIARPLELPELFRPKAAGGLLADGGRLDIFNCLRRADEISFAGGVFAVLETPDADAGRLFAAKGMPVSRDRRHLLVYNPTHLLGAEAAMSVLVAARLGLSTGAATSAPVCDVSAIATRRLGVGQRLQAVGDRHRIDGLAPRLTDYAPAAAALPYFMAEGRVLVREVAAGATICAADVGAPEGSALWALRAEQDALAAAGELAG